MEGLQGPEPAATGDPPRIRKLPDALVDQIAAGEVVERPASVAKELVENALDAGAGRIRIEIREGGTALVAVTDDGFGMTAQEARLCLQRHATSKLAVAEDLARIRSYGFRGEALPAIASVSRLRLRTRRRGAASGVELRVECGRLLEERPAGGPEGTRVEVAELFAAVPARRKFLKTPQTEWGHVADWVARMALARPGLHLELVRDDRLARSWPAVTEPLDRVAAVLSEADAAAMVATEHTETGLVLRALASRPDRHRSSSDGLYLFVNGRPVRDRLLRHAVLEPYRDVLPRARFPTVLLFVEVPPDAVDVNVHPAKWEVRFADPRFLHRSVSRALRDALARRSWLGGGARPAAGAAAVGAPLAPDATARAGRGPHGSDRDGAPAARAAAPSDWRLAPRVPGALWETRRVPDAADGQGQPVGATLREAPAAGWEAEALRFADLRLLGQLAGTYLLLEGPHGLLLVDQHAAHERVLYERLRAGWRAGGVARQSLLLPEVVDLAPGAHAAIVAQRDAAETMGFDLDAFGEAQVAVRAVPAILAGRDPAGLVRELADGMQAALGSDTDATPGARLLEAADRLFASLACHAARRKGDVLPPGEQQALLAGLDAIPWAPCCPHGRPVAVPLDLAEIERRFARR